MEYVETQDLPKRALHALAGRTIRRAAQDLGVSGTALYHAFKPERNQNRPQSLLLQVIAHYEKVAPVVIVGIPGDGAEGAE